LRFLPREITRDEATVGSSALRTIFWGYRRRITILALSQRGVRDLLPDLHFHVASRDGLVCLITETSTTPSILQRCPESRESIRFRLSTFYSHKDEIPLVLSVDQGCPRLLEVTPVCLISHWGVQEEDGEG